MGPIARTCVFPGETDKERSRFRAAWCRYLDNINYPKEKRDEKSPEFELMRDAWIKEKVMKDKWKAINRNNLNPKTPEKPLSGPSALELEKTLIPPTTTNLIPANVPQKVAKKLGNTYGVKKKLVPANSPPTAFHSPLKVKDWLVKYCPNIYQGSLYKSQEEMLDHMLKNKWCALEMFRAAGKSMLCIGVLAYMICENPNIRLFLMSEEEKKTIQRVRLVKKILMSPLIVQDYGFLVNEGKSREGGLSTQSQFECYRQIDCIEPTLMAITWKDAKSLGYHFDGGMLDDPWSIKLQNEENSIEKWLEWWGEFRFCLDQAQFCYLLRTRKALHDLYEKIDEKKIFATFKRKMVYQMPSKFEYFENEAGIIDRVEYTKDFQIYDDCKGKYTIDRLLIIRHDDPYYFEREMQNNPYLIEGDLFKWANLHIFNYGSGDEIIQGYLKQKATDAIKIVKMMDLAFGESDAADLNCLLVIGLYRNRYFIMDSWAGHWDFDTRVKWIKEAEEKYPGAPLYIEADFAQNQLIKEIKKKVPHLTIRPFISKGKGQNFKGLYDGQKKAEKKGKIHDALVVPWGDGRMYVRHDLPALELLKDQITQFPKSTEFDVIDCLAMAVIALRTSTSAKLLTS